MLLERLGFAVFATAVCLFAIVLPKSVRGANTQNSSYWYASTISEDANGPLDLRAELNYDSLRANAPIAVVMHGYSGASGHFNNVRENAVELRDAGFFVISVAMRGREGSDGVRDSGGLEIYDIYDAVESVKSDFAGLVDPTNVHITGYSGGGGNVMSAVTKFPDYFRVGSAFFGMSDYGYDTADGWYFNGASGSHRNQLIADVGNPDPSTGGGRATVKDRYMARASSLAAQNNPYSEIHLFVNDNEVTSPLVNDFNYQNSALANATSPGEFENIHLHTGISSSPEYVDFNDNQVNEPDERQWWPHSYLSATQQRSGELHYRDRLLAGEIPQPVLNSNDSLFVAGFVKTQQFELRVGDGQQGAGLLDYAFSVDQIEMNFSIESESKVLGTDLWVNTLSLEASHLDLFVDGDFIETLENSGMIHTSALQHGVSLVIQSTLAGDYNRDGSVELQDYELWKTSFGGTGDLRADGNFDGVVDSADYTVWRNNLGTTRDTPGLHVASTNVPEATSIQQLVIIAVMLGFLAPKPSCSSNVTAQKIKLLMRKSAFVRFF